METLLVVLCCVVGGGLVGLFAKRSGVTQRPLQQRLRAARQLDGATPVGTLVTVIGMVCPLDDELDAPLSGRPCVAYDASVFPNGGVARHATACTRFAVEPASGSRVVIESSHVVLEFPPLPLPADAAERCVEFALACGLGPRQLKRATYEEAIVIEGMRIAVGGRLVAQATDDAPARIAGDEAHPVIIGVPF